MTDEEFIQAMADGAGIAGIEVEGYDEKTQILHLNVRLQPPPTVIYTFTINIDETPA